MDKPMSQLKDFLRDHDDRRQDPRYACRISGWIQAGAESLPCEITSLSNRGLSALCSGALEKGQEVSVRTHQSDRTDAVLCRVGWAGKPGGEQTVRLFALEALPGISASSWWRQALDDLSTRTKETRQRRGGVRVACNINASCLAGSSRYEVNIRDIGTAGARLECPGATLGEDPLLLCFGPDDALPQIQVRADVTQRYEQEQYGVVFAGFDQGSSRDILDLMNRLFAARRAGTGGKGP